jgi:nucleolar protein 9
MLLVFFSAMLANNVLDQIKGKEADFMKNQLASRVIDNVIPYSSQENFERIATVISSDFRIYIDDQFASYIIQTMLKTCLYRNLQKLEHSPDTFSKPNTSKQITFNLAETYEDDHIVFCNDFLTKTSKFLLNNMEEYVFESYGNFIIRTCLCCLVGIGVVVTKTQATSTPTSLSLDVADLVKTCEAPANWKEIFFEYVSRLSSWPHWKDFPYESKTSGLLQIIIKCLSEEKAKKQITKLCKPFFTKKVVADDDEKKNKKGEDLIVENHEIFSNQASLHFLEGVLAAAGSKLSLHIYLNLFAGNLKGLSCDKIANFSVQRLMEHCQDKNMFELIFDEIVEHIEDIICIGYTGVVIELAKGCNRLATKQGQFVQVRIYKLQIFLFVL